MCRCFGHALGLLIFTDTSRLCPEVVTIATACWSADMVWLYTSTQLILPKQLRLQTSCYCYENKSYLLATACSKACLPCCSRESSLVAPLWLGFSCRMLSKSPSAAAKSQVDRRSRPLHCCTEAQYDHMQHICWLMAVIQLAFDDAVTPDAA